MQAIQQLLIDENNMAFHSVMGNSYKLNPISNEIIQWLKQAKNKDEIISLLHEKYQISKDDLFIDVSDFLAKLKIYGLYL